MDLLHANDRPAEHAPSWYLATAEGLVERAAFAGDVTADVAVVGAGFTGLSAALHLAQAGLSVVVLDAQRVGWGASGRNGGQVGTGQRVDQRELEAQMGLEDARRLWLIAEEAKALVQDLITGHGMRGVDWRPGIAHACRTAREVDDGQRLAEHLARRYGYEHISQLDRDAMAELLGTGVHAGGDLDGGAGHIHPLNFALGLALAAEKAGALVHERSQVLEIIRPGTPGGRHVLRTAAGRLSAAQVVLACNGYMGGLVPEVARRVMPINNFIIATQPLVALAPMSQPVAVADSRFVVNYWRQTRDGRLLFGGGESYGWRFPDIIRTVTKPMLEIYPQLYNARIDHAWGGTLAITRTRNPCFMQVAPGIVSASGYSGHGVAMATMAGRIMAEMLRGQAGRFDLMARLPTPGFPGGAMLRHPALVLAMTWYALRDRMGI